MRRCCLNRNQGKVAVALWCTGHQDRVAESCGISRLRNNSGHAPQRARRVTKLPPPRPVTRDNQRRSEYKQPLPLANWSYGDPYHRAPDPCPLASASQYTARKTRLRILLGLHRPQGFARSSQLSYDAHATNARDTLGAVVDDQVLVHRFGAPFPSIVVIDNYDTSVPHMWK